jgi:hypothetical protein
MRATRRNIGFRRPPRPSHFCAARAALLRTPSAAFFRSRLHPLRSFGASSEYSQRPTRRPSPRTPPCGDPRDLRTAPSLGFDPRRDITVARPPSAGIPSPLRSALRVSHPLDGLLRAIACGFVSRRSHVQGFRASGLQGFCSLPDSGATSRWPLPPRRFPSAPLPATCVAGATTRSCDLEALLRPGPRPRRARYYPCTALRSPLGLSLSRALPLTAATRTLSGSGSSPELRERVPCGPRTLLPRVSRHGEPGWTVSSLPALLRFSTSSPPNPSCESPGSVSVSSERPASHRALGRRALRVACQVHAGQTFAHLRANPRRPQRLRLVHGSSTGC